MITVLRCQVKDSAKNFSLLSFFFVLFLMTLMIRFAAIFHKSGDLIVGRMRDGLDSYLNKEETERTIRHTILRWQTRDKVTQKIGIAEWAMAKYGKVFRFTVPLNNQKLILVSSELDVNHSEIVQKIVELAKAE